ncbi:MAG: hypothetical protein IJL87_02215 [Clostridia bacterium]|nr:hypothetical protein [Clostridia bacterium]
MSRKIFSEKIEPACKYCVYSEKRSGHVYCTKKRKNPEVDPADSCFRYKYNPLDRVPEVVPDLPEFKAEDFSID